MVTGDDEKASAEDNKDDVDDSLLKLKALTVCRILSRDSIDLNESIENDHVDILAQVIDSSSLRFAIYYY